MTDRDESLTRLLLDAAPQPLHALDPAAIRNAARATTPRGRRALLPTAVVLGVLGILGIMASTAAIAVLHGSGGDDPDRDRTSTVRSPQQQTSTAMQHLVDRLSVPAGFREESRPPVAALNSGPPEPTGDVVDRARFFTSQESSDPTDHIAALLPRSFTTGPRGTSRATTFAIYYPGVAWQQPEVYTDPEVVVTTVRIPSGFAVRLDAVALWVYARAADQTVPTDPRSVTVVIDRGTNAPTVRTTLDADAAQHVTAMLNAATPNPAHSTMECDKAAPHVTWLDTVTVRGPHYSLTARLRPDNCDDALFGSELHNGFHVPGLDRYLLRQLGLPADYGG